MSEIKSGGPAFPRSSQCSNDATIDSEGMSLRDYFAAQAMVGLIQNHAGIVAKQAYEFADAMLAERAKEPSK